jgi:hypothetical protein
MLSMLAEDVIGPFIGIPATSRWHPVNQRLPYFLGYYTYDPTVWLDGSAVYYSYANAYALGAYLVRNFGGAALIQEIMGNSAVDTASITSALSGSANPLRTQAGSFGAALSRYGEALVFGGGGGSTLSFNNTVTHSIGGTDYTFEGFDIWNIANTRNKAMGPVLFDAGTAYAIPARTMLPQTKSAWKNISGSLSLTVRKPVSKDIEVYVMIMSN